MVLFPLSFFSLFSLSLSLSHSPTSYSLYELSPHTPPPQTTTTPSFQPLTPLQAGSERRVIEIDEAVASPGISSDLHRMKTVDLARHWLNVKVVGVPPFLRSLIPSLSMLPC
jgi:hypothetical protein